MDEDEIYSFTYDGSFWNRGISPKTDLHIQKGSKIYQRYLDTLLLLDQTRDYYKYKLPKVTLNICLSDNNPPPDKYADDDIKICVTECYEDDPFFVIPDSDYCGWSSILEDTSRPCDRKDQARRKKQKAVIYYRGMSDIASEIEDRVLRSSIFDIKGPRFGDVELDREELCMNSYLLDLPETRGGRNLKYMFLCEGSVVVRVEEKIQFLDLFIEPNVDYLSVGGDEIGEIVDKLEKIGESNPRRFSKIRSRGNQKVRSIANEDIYRYIRKLCYSQNNYK